MTEIISFDESTEPHDIILSGPIHYRTEFACAYANARQDYFVRTGKLPKVWNPAILPSGRSETWYIARCLECIINSPNGVLAMMPDWQSSDGSVAEHALAKKLKRAIVYLEASK